jgi:hypothetical protein
MSLAKSRLIPDLLAAGAFLTVGTGALVFWIMVLEKSDGPLAGIARGEDLRWELSTQENKQQARLSREGTFYSVSFSADSKLLAAGRSRNKIYVWDVASRTKKCELEVHASHGDPTTSEVTFAAFSPKGRTLLVSGWDCDPLFGWDLANAQKPNLLWHSKLTMNGDNLAALDEGDLSERARRRAAELANDADLRLSPPRPAKPRPAAILQAGPTRRSTKRNVPQLRPGTILARSRQDRPYVWRTTAALARVYRQQCLLRRNIESSYPNLIRARGQLTPTRPFDDAARSDQATTQAHRQPQSVLQEESIATQIPTSFALPSLTSSPASPATLGEFPRRNGAASSPSRVPPDRGGLIP